MHKTQIQQKLNRLSIAWYPVDISLPGRSVQSSATSMAMGNIQPLHYYYTKLFTM